MPIKHAIAAGAAVVTAAVGLTTAVAAPANAATGITCTTGLFTDAGGGILLASGCRPAEGDSAPYTFQVQNELGTRTPQTLTCQTSNLLTAEQFDQAITLLTFAVPSLLWLAPELRAAGPDYWGGGQCTRQ